ncbi:MAG TPA: hypothetical protein VJ785_04655 [Anaerolineales bacterium]|nr:hypothetical protein [Anaerolineales bacterium]
MLSNFSRWLTYILAVLYAVLGALLFFFPETLSTVFAWKVTAFMTMTIGGWCLGNAWLAWITAQRWQWNLVFSALLYLWLFGVGELLIVFNFRDKLALAHPIAWLYLITLLVNTLAALIGFIDWLRIRPSAKSSGAGFTGFQYGSLIAFIIFVGFLGIYGLTAQLGAPGTNGGIFPEIMTLFTLRSFGMFYLCIALAVVPFLWNRNFNAILHHSIASYGLIIFITIAAFVYLRLFDFAAKLGGALYFLAYLAVGIPLLFIFRKHGTGTPE